MGHLLNDADEGEDKIGKKAKALQLEPMEVAHFYTKKYQEAMSSLNVKTPSIEPTASDIIEQIEMVKNIIMVLPMKLTVQYTLMLLNTTLNIITVFFQVEK